MKRSRKYMGFMLVLFVFLLFIIPTLTIQVNKAMEKDEWIEFTIYNKKFVDKYNPKETTYSICGGTINWTYEPNPAIPEDSDSFWRLLKKYEIYIKNAHLMGYYYSTTDSVEIALIRWEMKIGINSWEPYGYYKGRIDCDLTSEFSAGTQEWIEWTAIEPTSSYLTYAKAWDAEFYCPFTLRFDVRFQMRNDNDVVKADVINSATFYES